MQLGDIATTIFSGRPVTRMRAEEGGLEMPVVTVRDVTTRLPARSTLDVIGVNEERDFERLVLQPGDVVVTARGSSVRAAVAREEHEGVLPGANLIVVRIEKISPHLLAAYLRHPSVQKHLLSEFSGSSTLGFTVAGLRRLNLRELPEGEAQRLAEMAQAVEEYARHTERAAELRQRAATEAAFSRLWSGDL